MDKTCGFRSGDLNQQEGETSVPAFYSLGPGLSHTRFISRWSYRGNRLS